MLADCCVWRRGGHHGGRRTTAATMVGGVFYLTSLHLALANCVLGVHPLNCSALTYNTEKLDYHWKKQLSMHILLVPRGDKEYGKYKSKTALRHHKNPNCVSRQ